MEYNMYFFDYVLILSSLQSKFRGRNSLKWGRIVTLEVFQKINIFYDIQEFQRI